MNSLFLKPRNPQVTLSSAITGRCWNIEKKTWVYQKVTLTKEEKDSFVEYFGKKCTQKRKERLRWFIENLDVAADHESFGRIYFGDYGIPCQFIPGQDCASGKAWVRKLMCGR